MPDAKTIILEYVFPAIGTIAANQMFFAPFRDVQKAIARGSIGDLNPLPWVFMLGNCLGWTLYSILNTNYFVFAANAPGFFLAAWFNLAASKLLFKQQFAKLPVNDNIAQIDYAKLPAGTGSGTDIESSNNSDSRVRDGEGNPKTFPAARTTALAEIPVFYTAPHHDYLIMGMLVLWVAVMAVIGYAKSFSNDTRVTIVGVVTNLNLVFFYAAPLSSIQRVLKSKNSASIHVPTMLTNTISSVFWGIYGLAVLDFFIFVPNTLGACLGFAQIGVYLIFPREETIVVPVITASAPVEGGGPDGDGHIGVIQLQLHEINLEGITVNIAENTVTQVPVEDSPLETATSGGVNYNSVSPELSQNHSTNEGSERNTAPLAAAAATIIERDVDRHPLTVNFAEESHTNVVTATSVIHRRLPSESVDTSLMLAFATLPETFGFGGASPSRLNSNDLGLHRRTGSRGGGGRGHQRSLSSGSTLVEAAELPTAANTRHRRVFSTGGGGAS